MARAAKKKLYYEWLSSLSQDGLSREKALQDALLVRAKREDLTRPWWRRPIPLLATLVGGVVAPVAVGVWSILTGAWNIDAKRQALDQEEQRLQLESKRLELDISSMRSQRDKLASDVERLTTLHELAQLTFIVVEKDGHVSATGRLSQAVKHPPTITSMSNLVTLLARAKVSRLTVQDATDDFVRELSKTMSDDITHLAIGGDWIVDWPQLSDDSLRAVSKMRRLRWLGVTSMSITDIGFRLLLDSDSLEDVV